MDSRKRSINLTQQEPYKRLLEFCKQGNFFFTIKHHEFTNGYLMRCEITYKPVKGKYGRPITHEVQWVKTNDLVNARNTICAILLDRIGLGVTDEDEPEQETNIFEQMTRAVDEVRERTKDDPIAGPLLDAASSMIQTTTQSWGDMYDEEMANPRSYADVCK